MRTEIAFTLPRGWVDASGETHREGRMRLATARDEIEPLRDPAVRENEAYLGVLLLARVVTSIGPVTDVTPEMIEGLFAADFDHLHRGTDGHAEPCLGDAVGGEDLTLPLRCRPAMTPHRRENEG